MSTPARHHEYTFVEYLGLEEASNTKHEYFGGDIYAMAGGTPEHAALCANVIVALGGQLTGHPCRLFSSDLRVRVLATGLATYPDATVICGEMETDPESRTTIVNPTLVVEVLSDSTANYDRGEKLAHYQKIPSLQVCVLVSHREERVAVYLRDIEQWQRHEARPGEQITLDAIGCTLAVDDIYRGISLNAVTEKAGA